MLKVVKGEGDVLQSRLVKTRQAGSGILGGEVYANTNVSGIPAEVWVAQKGGDLVQGSLFFVCVQSFQIYVHLKVVDGVEVSDKVLGDLLVD